jgi:hypothetical protein
LLFLTNLIAISAAGGLVFLGLGFRPELKIQARARVFAGGVISVIILLMAVTVPLGILTINSLRDAEFNQNLETVLTEEIATMDRVELLDWQITEDDGETLSLELSVRAPRQPSHQSVVELQKQVANRLQRPVALRLTVIPITQLDPFVPPTFTPTAMPTATPTATLLPTAGPSGTPTSTPPATDVATHTPTHTATGAPTSTATDMPTSVPTSTVTHTPAPTILPTPTPITALILGTGGQGLRIRQTPGGTIAGVLQEGDPVEILYRRQAVDDLQWIEIRDQEGRVGWVAAQYVQPQP